MSSVLNMLKGGKRKSRRSRRGRGRKHRRSSRRYQNQNENENQNQNQFQFQGGQATDEYVAKVVGGMDAQVGTAGPTSGAVVLKQAGGELSLAPASFGAAPVSAPVAQKGGKRGGNKGGNLLGEIAVPAVLLYANQAFGKRRSTASKRPFRKFRGSRRFRR